MNNDLIWYSLVSFLIDKQRSWKSKTIKFIGRHGALTSTRPDKLQPKDCSSFSKESFQEKLSSVGNVFAENSLKGISKSICLPPNTELSLTPEELLIKNPFGEISFSLLSSGSISYMKPGTKGLKPPQLPEEKGGGGQFETRLTGIQVKMVQSALYSHHFNSKMYEEWRNKLVDEAKVWFEGNTSQNNN